MKSKKLIYPLVCLFAPFILSSCSQSENKITVAEVTHSIFYAPMYVAQSKGFFKEEGLTVNFITTPGADKTMAALLSKEAQIGLMGPEASVYVYNNGQKNYAINFAQLTQKDGSFLVSRDAYEHFGYEDLKGHTIIGGRKGGMPEMILEYVLKQKGFEVGRDDPTKEIHIRTDIAFDVMGGAFSSGEGDFVTLFEPAATQMEKLKLGYIVSSLGEESGNIPYTCFSALKKYHSTNEKQIQKFTNAIYKALVWVHENDAQTVAKAIQKSFTSSDLEELTTVVERYKSIQAWPTTLQLTEESFNKLQEIVELAGELTKRAPYEKLVTTKYAINAMKS